MIQNAFSFFIIQFISRQIIGANVEIYSVPSWEIQFYVFLTVIKRVVYFFLANFAEIFGSSKALAFKILF